MNRVIKFTVLLVLVGMLISAGGCESVWLDGFSVGVVYLNTDITTGNTISTPYGQITGKQISSVEGIIPTASLNFRFK